MPEVWVRELCCTKANGEGHLLEEWFSEGAGSLCWLITRGTELLFVLELPHCSAWKPRCRFMLLMLLGLLFFLHIAEWLFKMRKLSNVNNAPCIKKKLNTAYIRIYKKMRWNKIIKVKRKDCCAYLSLTLTTWMQAFAKCNFHFSLQMWVIKCDPR